MRKLIDKWLNAKGFERESPSFLNGLENLLDLRPTNLYDLDNLAQALKNLGNDEWEKDLEFFQGQLTIPQSSSMAPSEDHVFQEKIRKRRDRSAKLQLYNKKIQESLSEESSVSAHPVCSKSDISEDNIILSPKRKAATAALETIDMIKVIFAID